MTATALRPARFGVVLRLPAVMGWCAGVECDDGKVNTDACLNDCLNASCRWSSPHRPATRRRRVRVCSGNFREDDACLVNAK